MSRRFLHGLTIVDGTKDVDALLLVARYRKDEGARPHGENQSVVRSFGAFGVDDDFFLSIDPSHSIAQLEADTVCVVPIPGMDRDLIPIRFSRKNV